MRDAHPASTNRVNSAAAGTKRFNKLWHRVFVYTLLLVVVSQLAVFVLFFFTQDREYRQKWLEDYVGSLAATLTEQDIGAANVFLQHINRRDLRMWIERADGTPLSGTARPGFSFDERQRFPYPAVQRGAVTIIDTKIEGHTTFCMAPVSFTTGSGMLCYAFPGYDSTTPVQDIFYQGLLALCIVGGLMSFWIARTVAFPLHALRSEALEIAGNNFDKRITVQGYDEITDVADAVNNLTENLVKHILGMQTLLANISHELRSPLTRMELYSTMIEEGVTELQDSRARDEAASRRPLPESCSRSSLIMANLHNLQQELTHLEGIIGTSLLLSKLNLQTDSSAFEPVAFSELCVEMLSRYAAVFTAGNLLVERDIQPGIWLPGEETLLCHMLSNLLDNAVKYTAPGGSVRVTLQQQHADTASRTIKKDSSGPGHILLRLENSHAPLPIETLERLFDPFYRAGIATGDGVGLGLSLVQKIAALHGGAAKAKNILQGSTSAVRMEISFSLVTGELY